MNWIPLTNQQQLVDIKAESHKHPVVIFKHSTTCSISNMAKNRLERVQPITDVSFYYLDLLQHRSISNQVAEYFGVRHESPQILLLKNGECVYDESHNGISMDEIAVAVKNNN